MDPLNYGHLYIGGTRRAPSSRDRIQVASASTEEPLGSVPEARPADVDAAVDAARLAFDAPDGWANWEPQRRADAMERLAVALDVRGPEIARLVSAQNGAPIAQSTNLEGALPAVLLRYYAGLATHGLADETRSGLLGGTTQVRRLPLGVVGAIVPWNAPQTLAFAKLAPAMAAGCTTVMKPSRETVLDSYVLAEAIEEARIPAGVINIVPGGRETGAYLVAHPRVNKISFTGSTGAGRSIAEVCGRLLRPVSLELGGKSAAIVLDDVDLTRHLESLLRASMLTNGQTCFASTRILLPQSRYNELLEAITSFVSSLSVGDALDPATQVGPLVSQGQRDRVEGYIAKGLSDGARLTTGGSCPHDQPRGWFVSPTVFADVDNGSTIAQEEIFGPVLAIIAYRDEAHAIAIANASNYGLGGSVWTEDRDRGLKVARQIQTGSVGLIGAPPDLASPFGGWKDSGIGREFGPEGLAPYLAYQSIYLPPKG